VTVCARVKEREGGHAHVLHRMVRADVGRALPAELAAEEALPFMLSHVFRVWLVGNTPLRMGNLSSPSVLHGLDELYSLSPADILKVSLGLQ
jgi:hypothetical protein